jgi:hypothetical protein
MRNRSRFIACKVGLTSVVKGFAKHLQRGGIEVARAFDHPSRFRHRLSQFIVTSVRGYQIRLTRYEP